MKRIIIKLIFILFFYFFYPHISYATFSLKIASLSANIISSTEEAVLVNLSITDLPSDSYFRVAFQKQDNSAYFGYFKNHLDQWVNVSDNCQNYYFINDLSLKELTIALKIGNNNIENGNYQIKAHRYTSSCKTNTPSENIFPIEINLPSPTPTLTPSPSITPTPTLILTNTPTPTITPTNNLSPTPTIEPVSFNNIFISEVMVNPNSQEKEWIEIYNNNDFDVNLENWYLDDIENSGASLRQFSCFIKTKNYCLIELNSSIFNNSGDSVRLLDFNKNLKDDFEYQNSQQGKSYGRINFENNDFCLQDPSPNQENNSCLINLTPSPILTSNPILPTKPINSNIILKPTLTNKNNKLQTLKPNNKVQFTTYHPLTLKKHPNNLYPEKNILGVSHKKNYLSKNQSYIILNFLSLFYCFLTIISLLIKIKIITYEKIKRVFSSFIYSQ